MNPDAVLAAFDEQIRRRPEPGAHFEHDAGVIRSIAEQGWTGVTWTDLDEHTAEDAIAAQVRRFAALGRSWEWKHYSHDRPADLPDRLRAAGLTPGTPEALLVADLTELTPAAPAPTGVRLAPVRDRADIDALVSVHDQVFGGDHAPYGAALLADIAEDRAAGVLALAGDTPVSAARVVFHHGTEFASLWGGGTLPGWRGRGIFRALVAHRAALAATRGFRYLQVDALPASRPILSRLGFVELATTTPFIGGRE